MGNDTRPSRNVLGTILTHPWRSAAVAVALSAVFTALFARLTHYGPDDTVLMAASVFVCANLFVWLVVGEAVVISLLRNALSDRKQANPVVSFGNASLATALCSVAVTAVSAGCVLPLLAPVLGNGPAGLVAFLVSGIGGFCVAFALVMVAVRADNADPKEG
jgi:hypothetical protein